MKPEHEEGSMFFLGEEAFHSSGGRRLIKVEEISNLGWVKTHISADVQWLPRVHQTLHEAVNRKLLQAKHKYDLLCM